MKIFKIALTDSEGRDLKDNVRDIKKDIRDGKKSVRDIENRLVKIEKIIDGLNLGHRQFWQMKNTFNSVERKLEKLDLVAKEWQKFKEEGMSNRIKKEVEQKFRASINI